MIDDPRLTAYALGELEGDSKAEVENLLAENPELRAQVEAISQAARVLKAGFDSEALPVLGDERIKGLQERFALDLRQSQKNRHWFAHWQNFRFPVLGLGTVAVATLCFVLVLPLYQSKLVVPVSEKSSAPAESESNFDKAGFDSAPAPESFAPLGASKEKPQAQEYEVAQAEPDSAFESQAARESVNRRRRNPVVGGGQETRARKQDLDKLVALKKSRGRKALKTSPIMEKRLVEQNLSRQEDSTVVIALHNEMQTNADRQSVISVVQRNLSQVDECFQKERAKPSYLPREMQGKLYFTWQINASGSVQNPKFVPKRSQFINTALNQCIMTKIQALRFPVHSADQPQVVTYPFNFSP